MWAICLYAHPTKSKFYNLPKNRRLELITEEYYPYPDFVTKHADLVDAFSKHCITRSQRILIAWSDKLDERTELLLETPYTIENSKELDDMMSKTPKLWEAYKMCLADLEAEENKGKVMGGEQESLSESGMI